MPLLEIELQRGGTIVIADTMPRALNLFVR